jgi:glucans biosynthesis protein
MMLTGAGEWIWRPLANPKSLQVSAFSDLNPKGFGLIQRKRHYGDFLDLESKYERRPSLWVEPFGAWGEARRTL